MSKRKKQGSMIPYAKIPNTKEVKVGKAAVDKMFGESYVFVASDHKNDLSNSAYSWIGRIGRQRPDVVLNVRGLSMPQQYEVAKAFKKIYVDGLLHKVTVDDGPYESSAAMLEQFIRG